MCTAGTELQDKETLRPFGAAAQVREAAVRPPRSAALGVSVGVALQRLCWDAHESAAVLGRLAAPRLEPGAALALVAPLPLVSESA